MMSSKLIKVLQLFVDYLACFFLLVPIFRVTAILFYQTSASSFSFPTSVPEIGMNVADAEFYLLLYTEHMYKQTRILRWSD
jgi:hypothetical protein